MNKEMFNLYQRKTGSVLAFSLIILFMMMAIAASLSVSTVINKKSASGTDSSVQALQTSDSGVQLAMRKINTELKNTNPGTILSIFPGCDLATYDVNGNSDAIIGTYDLSFLDKAGTKLKCDAIVSEIALVKSVGRYNGTVRLIDVAVDSGCPPTVKDNDGNTYQTVFIGGLVTSQCWMKENLRTTKRVDGSALVDGLDVFSNTVGGLDATALPWGRLYSWDAAMGGHVAAVDGTEKIRGICPLGWHIPSNFDNINATSDISLLFDNLGGPANAGGRMKRSGVNASGLWNALPFTSYWNNPNAGSVDDDGFAAVGSGAYNSGGGFFSPLGESAWFWTSAQLNNSDAWYFVVVSISANATPNTMAKYHGLSVRCIKD